MPRVFNWSRTEHCDPDRLAFPEDEAAVVALVVEARAAGQRVRVGRGVGVEVDHRLVPPPPAI